MMQKNLKTAFYQIGFFGEAKVSLTSFESIFLKEILLTKENFTFTELQNLPAETVEDIFEAVKQITRGEKDKQKIENQKIKKKK